MAKSIEKKKARNLRKKGLSIREIAKKLGVSRSSASIWCCDVQLSKKQIEKLHLQMVRGSYKGRMLGVRMQKERKKKKIEECLLRAKKDISFLTKRELFLAGLSLYWGEGAKSCSNVRLYNSNPLAIRFVMKWFRESLGVKENDFQMYVNINHIHKNRLDDAVRYWSKITGVSIKQFKKPTLIQVRNKKIYKNFTEHYGTLSIRIAKSKYLLYQILGWIAALSEAG